jgi:hypothetical protein
VPAESETKAVYRDVPGSGYFVQLHASSQSDRRRRPQPHYGTTTTYLRSFGSFILCRLRYLPTERIDLIKIGGSSPGELKGGIFPTFLAFTPRNKIIFCWMAQVLLQGFDISSDYDGEMA